VAAPSARLICDRLWELGLVPGAATAAVRISDALHTNLLIDRARLAFSEREVKPLIASQVHPTTWTTLLQGDDLAAIPRAQRHLMFAKCDERIANLSADEESEKLRALITDISRLRDQLRSIDSTTRNAPAGPGASGGLRNPFARGDVLSAAHR
jgi:hypothetical protein